MTGYNSQTAKGDYRLQFETDDYDKFRYVEEAARRCVDNRHTEVCCPVVHAHWETEPYYDNDEEACYDILSCSHCHYPFTGREYEFVKNHDKLCPECGARMDEEAKGDEV